METGSFFLWLLKEHDSQIICQNKNSENSKHCGVKKRSPKVVGSMESPRSPHSAAKATTTLHHILRGHLKRKSLHSKIFDWDNHGPQVKGQRLKGPNKKHRTQISAWFEHSLLAPMMSTLAATKPTWLQWPNSLPQKRLDLDRKSWPKSKNMGAPARSNSKKPIGSKTNLWAMRDSSPCNVPAKHQKRNLPPRQSSPTFQSYLESGGKQKPHICKTKMLMLSCPAQNQLCPVIKMNLNHGKEQE